MLRYAGSKGTSSSDIELSLERTYVDRWQDAINMSYLETVDSNIQEMVLISLAAVDCQCAQSYAELLDDLEAASFATGVQLCRIMSLSFDRMLCLPEGIRGLLVSAVTQYLPIVPRDLRNAVRDGENLASQTVINLMSAGDCIEDEIRYWNWAKLRLLQHLIVPGH